MAGRKRVNPRRDRRVFRKTAGVKSLNISGRVLGRGGGSL